MSVLSEHVQDYLRLRRAMGFRFEREGQLLANFASYVESTGATVITGEAAIGWARHPVTAQSVRWAKRLGVVRRFAAYLQAIDPATEVPPSNVFSARWRRPTPYLWSQSDIIRLLQGSRKLRSPLRAATHEALFGLLAVSGMRVGEAISLQRGDVDLSRGVITIREAKFDRPRLVPLHASATEALRRYAAERDRLCPRRSTAFFVSSAGTALDPSPVCKVFTRITTEMGIRTATVHPRIHDLRHSFAVRTLIAWQQTGVRIDEQIVTLSTYLGHVSPAGTYWYLSASSELMQFAAERLEARFGAVR